MQTIVVASSKGGSGKTTLSVNLAVEAARDGHRVVLLDSDPQGSALAWYGAREAELPYVFAVDSSEVAGALMLSSSEGYTLAIVDTQPRAAASLTRIARLADFVLVPMRPSALDVATAPTIAGLLVSAEASFTFVLNACPPRVKEVVESHAELLALGPTCDTRVGDRIIYSRALARGLGASETGPTVGPASVEMSALWSEVARRANVVSYSHA